MDPVLIIALVAGGVLLGPKAIKYVAAKTIVTLDDNKRENEQENMLKKQYKQKLKREKNRQKLIARGIDPDKDIKNDMDRFHNLPFYGIKSGKKTVVSVREDASFNESEDVLLKGRLHLVDTNGKKTVQDIYLYQPRVFTYENALLGPKLNKEGKLSDKYTYLCRETGGEILTGYVPKREVFTGMQFDYTPNATHRFAERVPNYKDFLTEDGMQAKQFENYINIDIPKDQNGDYIPVNLNNPEERAEFEKYKSSHLGNKKTPQEYFSEQLDIAETAFYKYMADNRPDYAVASRPSSESKNEPSDTEKTETEKKQEESINDFYKRYDYYSNPIFGERYNDYNGDYPTHNGPHRPRR